MSLPIVHHPDYRVTLRPGHGFPMSKYAYLREVLISRGLLPEVGGYFAPAPASLTQVATVHDADYVSRVASNTRTAEETRRIGLPDTPAVSRRAFLATAGTLLAARLSIEHGLACNMAGGSHHAGPESGSGYCVFNDVAVAAAILLNEGRAERILVVDLDVHQGDGTAQIFADDPRVFTLSLHAEKNFPARKVASDLDYPLPDNLKDAAYMEVLEDALQQASAVPADIIFYNAGVDPHVDDRLGRLALTSGGLRARDRRVLEWAAAQNTPCTCVLGGGYDRDPYRLAERHAILFEEAAKVFEHIPAGLVDTAPT